jgi:hypothetical protein
LLSSCTLLLPSTLLSSCTFVSTTIHMYIYNYIHCITLPVLHDV